MTDHHPQTPEQYTELVSGHSEAIRVNWGLESARHCLPQLIRPDGGAQSWPPDLLARLAQLSLATQHDHTAVVRELLRVWHLRLGRYPESDPDLCTQDVETVYKRRVFLSRASSVDQRKEKYESSIPRLDTFPSPPSWKKRKRASLEGNSSMAGTLTIDSEAPSRMAEVQTEKRQQDKESPEDRWRRKGKGHVRFQSPPVSLPKSPPGTLLASNHALKVADLDLTVVTSAGYIELANELMPIPENFSQEQKLTALRRREIFEVEDLAYLDLCIKQKMKKRNLAYTRYELSMYEVLTSKTDMREEPR
ncbi:hypothetical protein BDU57DRAFT_532901 [Ampelomyces quisqualis]|uniref:Uncharacterized protein n=1 Tax=Ampelomyces quisqualis TaxID=50730 RepID=A0A6A5Q945_AMPQU|nr:hypothetical protein BDU57DRAFT_532901 [Ampelomyces quisqualis]